MFHQDLTQGLGQHRGSHRAASGPWSSTHTHNAAWCGEAEGWWARPSRPQSEGREGHTTPHVGRSALLPTPAKFWMIL